MWTHGRVVPSWLGSAAVGLLASACADISGLQDYSVGPAADQAPSRAAADGPLSDASSGFDVASLDTSVCRQAGCGDAGDACSDCYVDSPGRPVSCTEKFGYAPSNFDPASYTAPELATTIDCNTTYDSTAHSFAGWCHGRAAPRVSSNLNQRNGPNVDILAFGALTVNPGSTLTLTGKNAVILAVYGDANIHGTIAADGAAGVSGSGVPGPSGPGGDYNCGGSAGGDGNTPTSNSGGGGGGASTAGGKGANDCPVVATGGAAGIPRLDVSLKPLYGGCPGGQSGPGGCTTGGGGGGGAVQISAAGALTVDGAITANGGAGGTSACTALIVGVNYYGGGGGGGAGGAILLEGHAVAVTGATAVQGGNGGASGGSGAGDPSSTGKDGTPSACTGTGIAGGGGGGGYGYEKTNTGAAPACLSDTCGDAGCTD
jgi:hypothetical protein